MEVYTTTTFTCKVTLEARFLGRAIEETLLKKLNERFNGRCVAKLGYVKPNTLRIVQRSLGQKMGSELDGNMTFACVVAADVIDTDTLVGTSFSAQVLDNTAAGVVAKHMMYPFVFYAERNEAAKELFDSALPGTYVKMQVEEEPELKPPNAGSDYQALYWIRCALTSANEETAHLVHAIDPLNVATLKATVVPCPATDTVPRIPKLHDTFKRLQQSKEQIEDMDQQYAQIAFTTPDLLRMAGIGSTNGIWSKLIRYVVSPYELCHPSGDYRKLMAYVEKHRNLPAPAKLNRAYFKMRLMLLEHDLLVPYETKPMLTVASIAESPGGFIQAIIDARVAILKKVTVHAVSLPPSETQDSWFKLREALKGNDSYASKVRVVDHDATEAHADEWNSELARVYCTDDVYGDVTDAQNRERFTSSVGREGADIVTADGGFRRDTRSDREEQELLELIVSETLLALNVQATDGAFVLKVFDVTQPATLNVLQVLRTCYAQVLLTKPRTSRFASSEKYVVCMGFVGQNAKETLAARAVLQQVLDHMQGTGDHIVSFLDGGDATDDFIAFARTFMEHQLSYIEEGHRFTTSYIGLASAVAQQRLVQAHLDRQRSMLSALLSEHPTLQ